MQNILQDPNKAAILRKFFIKPNSINNKFIEDSPEILDEEEDEEIIDLKFIVSECPPVKIVREYLKEQLGAIEENEEFII